MKTQEEIENENSKVISLFQFIKALNLIKQKAIVNIEKHQWHYELSDIPDNPDYISLYWQDRVDEEEEYSDETSNTADVILSVRKPEFSRYPEPDDEFAEWLQPEWDNFHKEATVKEFIEVKQEELEKDSIKEYQQNVEEPVIKFTDDNDRVMAYKSWLNKRDEWVAKQKLTEKTRNLFTDLFRLYFELQRESETEEIIVANGIICDRDNLDIKHPVLTHRVKIDYDADTNTVFVLETGASSELYTAIFQEIEDINVSGIKTSTLDLQKNDYHPLDRNDTPDFLKIFVHQLSSDSQFSDSGVPDKWSSNSRILLYLDPCFIVRKRIDGTVKAIEQIIDNVKRTGIVPAPIGHIVSGGMVDIPADNSASSVEEQLAAVGGESVDILLTKEANKEQLEIARRIESHDAVLVQGPPGTGKTHTIANLMGHFLAQGKSVLVTSHTKKALSVLKDKVDPGLQNLCVSVLSDSNVDMERSIDGITGYMSKTTSFELRREMEVIEVERREVIEKLAEVRRRIFAVIKQECDCIAYNGEGISPSKAAEFVVEHSECLSYIPGHVRLHSPLPLSFEQLAELYRSNESISAADEKELSNDLPDPQTIMIPSEFEMHWKARINSRKNRESIAADSQIKIESSENIKVLNLIWNAGRIRVNYSDRSNIENLKNYAASFGKIEKWMKVVAVDGKKGGSFRRRWITLLDQIRKSNEYEESVVTERFGNEIKFADFSQLQNLQTTYEALYAIFAEKGKIGKLTLMMHKEFTPALAAVTINGSQPQSADGCKLILHYIEQDAIRNKCAVYWDELLTKHDVPKFMELDQESQESVAANWVPFIEKYLDWYKDAYQPLLDKLALLEIDPDVIFEKNTLDSELTATDKILFAVEHVIPRICDICLETIAAEEHTDVINSTKTVLRSGKRGDSAICSSVYSAVESGDAAAYAEAYADLEKMYEKYNLRSKREGLLKMIEPVAPQWAEDIRLRVGIHGRVTVPDDIEDAWKWKQLCGIVDEITSNSFGELQKESTRLSKEYREITARYAEKSAWYHLLQRTEADINIKQALQGWKQTVKKIGKGTGKQAPALKAKARELMAKCQLAVPGWIMTINRALESLDPKINSFDIVIIDEASQSDISSLAILYMGKKLIIVGDDKQVSPMAIGIDVNKVINLQQMYIKDKIPNYHLYNAKTSIYDIAATTFQPLMLREHFRCVPEIIGFSNMLSYDHKIKPLRDASNSILLPAVVNYRVENGMRDGENKKNLEEARSIVALMKACMEQPEYKDKTFGVISLLGDDQVKLIQSIIEQKIEPKEMIARDILCGNSANFQGDERDVIFLSVVDSNDGTGPIHMMNFGPDDSNRKRYNVATSRAKDQLWVVDSIDPANDLKSGDIRKMLIEYSINPHAEEIKQAEVEKFAESPFEKDVAGYLVDRGYHIVQQWKVGAYRIDIVAVCGGKTVAIECDGERWHSGKEKIREDMERQTILERLGWTFIRIRGSEYYRDSEKTMKRVIDELSDYGIEPESINDIVPEGRNTELLNRVKRRASIILSEFDDEQKEINGDIVGYALSN